MTASTTDLILHALTGIRALMIAYHQMRTQAVVFIAGLAVAFASFMLSRHDEAGWVWVALLGPSVFLILALFLAMYFRQLIDCCQAIEAKLQDELQRAANTESPVPSSAAGESPSEATLKSRSAIHYRTA